MTPPPEALAAALALAAGPGIEATPERRAEVAAELLARCYDLDPEEVERVELAALLALDAPAALGARWDGAVRACRGYLAHGHGDPWHAAAEALLAPINLGRLARLPLLGVRGALLAAVPRSGSLPELVSASSRKD